MNIGNSLTNIAASLVSTVEAVVTGVQHVAQLLCSFLEAGKGAGKPLGEGVAATGGILSGTMSLVENFARVARHYGGPVGQMIYSPLVSAQHTVECALKPVDRLLRSFNLAVDRAFDGIDSFIGASAAPQLVPVPVTVQGRTPAPLP